jgi:hypothetical protein
MLKTLLSGCSLSDWCGFGNELARDNLPPIGRIGNHDDPRCWYNIVKQRFNLDLTNVSYGGYSNEEILDKILKELALVSADNYELVIIQLTSTQRKWFYRASNPFDFCLAHGTNSQNKMERDMCDYFRVFFNNELVEMEKTISKLVLIQNYLKIKHIPLILINGINFGSIFKKLITSTESYCQPRIPSELWNIKGKSYSNELHILASKINLDLFVGLDPTWSSLIIDKADDNSHPGEKSNILFANSVIEKIELLT